MVAAEIWRAKVPLSTIRNQLKMFERTLRRVLSFLKANPLNHIKPRKPMLARLKHSPQDLGSHYIQKGGMTRY